MKTNKLYSNLPEERLEAGLITNDLSICQEIKDVRPYYWFGSANAWIVFLGSSPGGSPPKGQEDKSFYKSQISFNETSKHLLNFDDSRKKNGFWEKIRMYTKYLFPNIPESNLYKAIMAGNLIDAQEGDSSKLDKEEIKNGAIESFKVLSIVKPKLVICLQKSVYELIYDLALKNNDKIQENDVLQINSGIKNNIQYNVPVTYLSSKDYLWRKWVLTRTPMHPSRSNFCNQNNFKEQYLKKLMAKMSEYLKH